ncbi:MAG: hypothetical protein ACF8Q5_10735 [Phycisphaerales bacterium JB040]
MAATDPFNIRGRFGHDYERVSRVYRMANAQPSWAARMAAFIVSTMVLLVVLVLLLPLILLVALAVLAFVAYARLRLAMARRGWFTRDPAHDSARRNVRVRRPEE